MTDLERLELILRRVLSHADRGGAVSPVLILEYIIEELRKVNADANQTNDRSKPAVD